MCFVYHGLTMEERSLMLSARRLKKTSLFRKYECTEGQRKNETPLFISILITVQKWNWYQHHGLLSTWIWCFKSFLRGPSIWGSQHNFNFLNVNPQIFRRNREVHLTNCLETNFHDISIISLRVIRRRNYT